MAHLDTTVGLLQLFGEPTRVRLCSLLSEHELSVAELTSITELTQSRVSTHLGKLREAGVLRDRKAGASTYYALDGGMPPEARQVWSLVHTQTGEGAFQKDRARLHAVLRAREQQFPEKFAGEMERHYSPGRTWEATARGFLGLGRFGDVLDAGCGDGTLAQLIAPRARSITCLDISETMIDAARTRLGKTAGANFVVGDLCEAPLRSASFDEALCFNVLTHVQEPLAALIQLERVLRKGGRVAIVTLAEHEHDDVTESYAHVNNGFKPPVLARMLGKAGFTVESCEVAARERRPPFFEIVTAFGVKE
jgi:ArsR family transcriptional regulator